MDEVDRSEYSIRYRRHGPRLEVGPGPGECRSPNAICMPTDTGTVAPDGVTLWVTWYGDAAVAFVRVAPEGAYAERQSQKSAEARVSIAR
jgi:hypothetical protein